MRTIRFFLCVILPIALIFVSACSGGGKAGQGAASSPAPSPGAEPTNGGVSSTREAHPDPFGKYETPVRITAARPTNSGIVFAGSDSWNNNVWHKVFKEELNIDFEYEWLVDASQYRQKLNVTIASGELPDVFEVNKIEMQRLYEADMIHDLTDLYEDYAAPYLKEIYTRDGGVALSLATIDGKLMGIPMTNPNGGVASSDMIWVRTDWLEALNLPEPKSIDDILQIAEAFAKADLGGTGKSYGLGVRKELFGGTGSIRGFMNGYHAYPGIWIEDENGQLVHGSIQPEVKQALAALADLYQKGVLDREFAVKDQAKVEEDIAAERIGLVYAGVAAATAVNGIKVSRANNPNAQWKAYPIVSVDGRKPLTESPDTAESFYVISKDVEHPEAVFKMLNVWQKLFFNTEYPSGMANPYAIQPETGAYPAMYAPVRVEPVTLNRDAFLEVIDALEKGDGSHLKYPASLHFERNMAYRNGDESMWFSDRTFGPEGAFNVVVQYYEEEQGIFNSFTGAPTPTMVEKMTTLDTMRDEIFTRIIMGESSIDEFDKFVEDWKRAGGNEITKEVNEWKQKQQ